MKIKELILENFRGFYGQTRIPFEDFTTFLGKNDQGKSTILEAIDIFINEGKGTVKIDENDLNKKASDEGQDSFKIGIVFKDLPDSLIIDATNPTNLKDEYLLNKDGFLEIWKVFKKGKVQDKETFLRCYHPANDDFLKELPNKKIRELQDFVQQNNITVSDSRKAAELRKAIRNYYYQRDGDFTFQNIDIKADAEGLRDIWGKLQDYLPIYALFHADRKNIDQDDEIQDPLKIKIEEIFKREDIQNKLDEIAKQINQEVTNIAEGTISKFNELSQQQVKINPSIPEVKNLKWKDVYKGIGFNTDNDIPLNKRGSGIRRLVLVSSFLAEVERKTSSDQKNKTIIYAVEEPETALHPDLQIKLIDALKTLSTKENYQIFLTTHSPALIRLVETPSIRYVEQNDGSTKVDSFNETVADKIIQNMGLLPNIGKVVICVEGTNDENFLININQNITELKQLVDLIAKIKSGIVAIIPMNGSNLKDWINRYALKNTNVIEFHLYDRDSDNKYQEEIKKVNARKDGSFGTLTGKREIENYVPKEIIEEEFKINITLNNSEEWDDINLTEKIRSLRNDLKESDIKKIICGKCSQKLTKKHLEDLNAWKEVKGWFEKIKELTDKVINN